MALHVKLFFDKWSSFKFNFQKMKYSASLLCIANASTEQRLLQSYGRLNFCWNIFKMPKVSYMTFKSHFWISYLSYNWVILSSMGISVIVKCKCFACIKKVIKGEMEVNLILQSGITAKKKWMKISVYKLNIIGWERGTTIKKAFNQKRKQSENEKRKKNPKISFSRCRCISLFQCIEKYSQKDTNKEE